MSFDRRSHKLATLAAKSFGHLGVGGSDFIDQLAALVVGGRDGGSMARKGVVKERLLHTGRHFEESVAVQAPA